MSLETLKKDGAPRPEAAYAPAARELLEAAEPGSNEYLLISQLELSRYNRQTADTQQYLYAFLREAAEAYMFRGRNDDGAGSVKQASKYLPHVSQFFRFMETYYRDLPRDSQRNHTCLHLSSLPKHLDKNIGYHLALATLLDLKPVIGDLPMNPNEIAREVDWERYEEHYQGESRAGEGVTLQREEGWIERHKAILQLQSKLEGFSRQARQPYEGPLNALRECYFGMVDAIYPKPLFPTRLYDTLTSHGMDEDQAATIAIDGRIGFDQAMGIENS